MGQGEVVVPRRGDISVLDQGEVEVTVEVPLDSRNVFEPRDAAHANLFTLLLVAERRRHVCEISRDEEGGTRSEL